MAVIKHRSRLYDPESVGLLILLYFLNCGRCLITVDDHVWVLSDSQIYAAITILDEMILLATMHHAISKCRGQSSQLLFIYFLVLQDYHQGRHHWGSIGGPPSIAVANAPTQQRIGWIASCSLVYTSVAIQIIMQVNFW
jgi:hypothetical protein